MPDNEPPGEYDALAASGHRHPAAGGGGCAAGDVQRRPVVCRGGGRIHLDQRVPLLHPGADPPLVGVGAVADAAGPSVRYWRYRQHDKRDDRAIRHGDIRAQGGRAQGPPRVVEELHQDSEHKGDPARACVDQLGRRRRRGARAEGTGHDRNGRRRAQLRRVAGGEVVSCEKYIYDSPTLRLYSKQKIKMLDTL